MRKVQSQFGVGSLQQKLAVGDLHFLADAEVARGGPEQDHRLMNILLLH